MKNKIGKIIEVILLVVGILATVAVVVAIPLKSYNEYADYLAWIAEINKPEPKPVLESISVELKEGVKYFKNDLAEPKASDFVVTANYTLEGAPYSEVIEEGKYSVSTKNDFYSKGGEITVTITPEVITAVFADVGPGIPDVSLAMTEGWSTASESVRDLGFGAGMGLPNIQKYTDRLDIQTEIGKGTTVTIEIDVA
jgi:hypothetical protein